MGVPRKLAKRSDKKEVRVTTHIPVLEMCFQHFKIERVLEHGMGKSSTAFFHKCNSLDFILSLEDDPAWKICSGCDLSLPRHTVASYTCKSDITLCLSYAFDPETTLVFLDGPHKQRGEIFEAALERGISYIVEHDTESLSNDEMRDRRVKAEGAGYTCLAYTRLNPETTLYTRKQFSHTELVPVISIRS